MLLAALAALSIATGLFITYKAIHAPPRPQFDVYASQQLWALRKEVGLSQNSRFFNSPSPWVLEAEKTFLMLIRIFQDLTSTRFGKGAFLFIFSLTAPIVTFTKVEALKPQAHRLMGGTAVMVIFFIGQLICLGAAFPIFYIPAVALVRALRPQDVFPQRAFPYSAIVLIKLMQLLFGLPSLLTAAVPPDHKHYFLVNTLFQFFPIVFIHIPAYKLFNRNTTSVSSRAVGDLFREGRISSTILYWASLGMMYPTLLHFAQGSYVEFTDAVKLILWDALGVFLTLVYLVAIDRIADPVPAGVTSRTNLHGDGKGLFSGVSKALAISLIFGPGTAMNNYLAKREDAVAPVHPGSEAVEAKTQ